MILAAAAPGRFGGPGFATNLAPLAGTRFFLAALADAPRNGIMLATFYLLVLLLVRTLLRGRATTLVFGFVLFALYLASFGVASGSPLSPVPVLLAALNSAGLTWILVRRGLLPAIVIASLSDLAVSMVSTFDLDAWYVDQTLWVMVLLLVAATWAYRTSLRPHSGAITSLDPA